jgi:hypothetical protein
MDIEGIISVDDDKSEELEDVLRSQDIESMFSEHKEVPK